MAESSSPAASLRNAPAVFRVMPAGHFRPEDGRELPSGGFYIDARLAASLIDQVHASGRRIVIDYEHQSLHTEKNGQPAPAAGWIAALDWREGQGLYATGVEWTARARAMLAAGEYRFISPTLYFDKATGHVQGLHSVALTNTPAVARIADLRGAARYQLPAGSESLKSFDPCRERARDMFRRTFGFELDA